MSRAQPVAFWSYGFRPFFLLAALAAVGTLAVLIAGLELGAWPSDALPLARWHGHEMLYGFVGAAIAGFLLTAVPTWTSTPPLSGVALAGLVSLWLAGRVVLSPYLAIRNTPLVLVDALFFPALAVAIARPLLASRNYRNLPFIVLLSLFAVADVLFLGWHFGWMMPLAFDPLRLVANVVQLMIALIGGRIVPLFTRNALLAKGVTVSVAPSPWIDRASFAALVGVIVVDVVRPDGSAAAATAVIAALLLAARLARWHGHRTLRMPIVWILHAGYAWLVAALALKAAWLYLASPWAAGWLHALTAGAFGTMVLGVMTRVALGHTGRPLVVARSITIAYVLVIAGAALRVVALALSPAHYVELLTVAAVSWAAGFVLFIAGYLPILIGPRVDESAVAARRS